MALTGVATRTAVHEEPAGVPGRRAGTLHRAWGDALAAWAALHALLLGAAAIALTSGAADQSLVGFRFVARRPVTWEALWGLWLRWRDASAYAAIAGKGYSTLDSTAFPPLQPLVERALAPVFGGDAALAGFALANIAALAAFAAFRLLVERETGDPRTTRLALALLALNPYALFFATGYAESLFLLLGIASFLALRSRRWLLAGGLAALAALTRVTGVLLALPLAWVALALWRGGTVGRSWRALRRPLVAALLPLAATGGFWLYTASLYGPGVAMRAEAAIWRRWLDWPWYGPLQGLGLLGHAHAPWYAVEATLDLAALALALWGCAALTRRGAALPGRYAAFAWAGTLLPLCMPLHPLPVDALAAQFSLPRYLMALFPLYVAAARPLARRPKAARLAVALSAGCCLLLAALYCCGFSVA